VGESESKIPFEELALDAAEVGKILGQAPRMVLEKIACRPGFPARLSARPATWRAGDILEWRDANRVGLPARRRKRCSTAASSADRGAR
jgi:hypothetical protein